MYTANEFHKRTTLNHQRQADHYPPPTAHCPLPTALQSPIPNPQSLTTLRDAVFQQVAQQQWRARIQLLYAWQPIKKKQESQTTPKVKQVFDTVLEDYQFIPQWSFSSNEPSPTLSLTAPSERFEV